METGERAFSKEMLKGDQSRTKRGLLSVVPETSCQRRIEGIAEGKDENSQKVTWGPFFVFLPSFVQKQVRAWRALFSDKA
jgi:hypothetical protein